MSKLLYYLLYGWMYLHALLPFSLLYLVSDIFYVLAYKIIGYRIKVVRRNLAASFPEKSEVELRKLEKDFYHHFCDYFVETIKLLHISDQEMAKRMKFENMELVREVSQGGRSVLMFLGHYGNWEWVTSITMQLKNDPIELGQIYRPLKNKAADDFFLKLRSRFGSFGISKQDTLRAIVRLRREGRQVMIGFMADQTPSVNNIHYWTNFLNQDTPVFTGVERIAKQTGFAVLYLDVQKVKRGHYVGTVKMISDSPQTDPEFIITERYIREMEKSILRNPAYWLWTHKRWKRTREQVAEAQHQHQQEK